MANQIRRWKAEHENFVRLLDILELQISLFHREAAVNYELMLDIVYYLTQYPDRFHHPREDIAFARLAERDASAELYVRELHGEHRVIATSGMKLVAQLNAILCDGILARESIEASAATYIVYYRQHMAREEKDLFPRVEDVLSDADWKIVGDAIAAEADPLFGTRIANRYQQLHRQIMRGTSASIAST